MADASPLTHSEIARAPTSGHGLMGVSDVVTVSTMTAVASLLLLRALTTGLLGDELLFVHAIDLGFVPSLCETGSSHPPLVRLIVGSIANSSSPDWLLRLPSVIFSVATVFVWSRVLRRLILDKTSRSLLLVAMALNPIWVELGFQCLPYAALTFFASLHCLAWLQICSARTKTATAVFVLTGIALPWTHFLGVNMLLADVLIWIAMLIGRRATLRHAIRTNLTICACTLAVVPIALFYIQVEAPYPLVEIDDFPAYFHRTSSLIFSHLTFSVFMTTLPLYIALYLSCAFFLWHSLRAADRNVENTTAGIIAVGAMLSGFTATQILSVASQNAMWPRYMLTGAWIHLPLIAFLLHRFSGRRLSMVFSAAAACCAASGLLTSPQVAGTGYDDVSSHISRNWQKSDAFLAQSMDFWSGPNHFDQLWFRRYVSRSHRIVSGPPTIRRDLHTDGLPLQMVDAGVDRVWVYSHLFRTEWMIDHPVDGWVLRSLHSTHAQCALALFERMGSSDVMVTTPQAMPAPCEFPETFVARAW
ncbi:MAG: hypothetical protein GY758_03725 [Fuerstiella sp.]|nr:hypothetical protein [Fuerstiella sp.]